MVTSRLLLISTPAIIHYLNEYGALLEVYRKYDADFSNSCAVVSRPLASESFEIHSYGLAGEFADCTTDWLDSKFIGQVSLLKKFVCLARKGDLPVHRFNLNTDTSGADSPAGRLFIEFIYFLLLFIRNGKHTQTALFHQLFLQYLAEGLASQFF